MYNIFDLKTNSDISSEPRLNNRTHFIEKIQVVLTRNYFALLNFYTMMFFIVMRPEKGAKTIRRTVIHSATVCSKDHVSRYRKLIQWIPIVILCGIGSRFCRIRIGWSARVTWYRRGFY